MDAGGSIWGKSGRVVKLDTISIYRRDEEEVETYLHNPHMLPWRAKGKLHLKLCCNN
jgi:hypothetical protein